MMNDRAFPPLELTDRESRGGGCGTRLFFSEIVAAPLVGGSRAFCNITMQVFILAASLPLLMVHPDFF